MTVVGKMDDLVLSGWDIAVVVVCLGIPLVNGILLWLVLRGGEGR